MSEPLTTVELARLYESQGYYAKAREHYLRLLALSPGDPELEGAVERLTADGVAGVATPDRDDLGMLARTWAGLLVLLKQEQDLHSLREKVV